jgi:hypothetical protein
VAALALAFAGAMRANAGQAEVERFACLIAGHWDNVAQASEDTRLGLGELERHPRRAMTYIPIENPTLDGQLFAILNYGDRGFDGPIARVSLHRFRAREDVDGFVHEFMFPLQPETLGDMTVDLRRLADLQETDMRINPDCAMHWRKEGAAFVGATRRGRCVTSSFTQEPVRVEGHGELRPRLLLRHDENFSLEGAPLPVAGAASPYRFDKVQREGFAAQLMPVRDGIVAGLPCD